MKFDKETMPKHIAIIMDGNRRWARAKGKPVSFGHKEGAKTLEKIVRYANKIGLEYITVYAFSTENWKRAEDEVKALMMLLQNYLDEYSKRADTENIRVKILGDITALSEGMQKSIKRCMERTKDKTGVTFNIALNYGGRAEIVRAAKEIAKEVENKKISLEDINEDLLERLNVCNIKSTINDIRHQSSTLRNLEKEGKIMIVGANYDVETGVVTWL